MTVDPTDPETFDIDDAAHPDTGPSEASEADLAEQRTNLAPARDEPLTAFDSADADPGDAAEQARVVELNEDDYR